MPKNDKDLFPGGVFVNSLIGESRNGVFLSFWYYNDSGTASGFTYAAEFVISHSRQFPIAG